MLWRLRKPARIERENPPSIFVPCAPIVAERPPAGAEWLHEVKHDGRRMLARKDDNHVRLWTKDDDDCAALYVQIAEAVAKLPIAGCMIDGEAVHVLPGGRSDFAALNAPGGGAAATLVCFDLLEVGGDNIRYYPIEERRALLFSILEEDPDAPLVFNRTFDHDGTDVLDRVCKLGLEGLVSKRRDSTYRSGTNPDWVVTPNPDYKRA